MSEISTFLLNCRDLIGKVSTKKPRLELNSSLRPNPRLEWMLYFSHFGDEVSGVDQFFRRVAAGDDNVQSRLSFAGGANFGGAQADRGEISAQAL